MSCASDMMEAANRPAFKGLMLVQPHGGGSAGSSQQLHQRNSSNSSQAQVLV
jgi:hypothetical protein